MGQWEAALAALCQVVAINDNHFEGHINLATVYHSRGAYDAAIVHAKKATELRPKNAMAHRVLGHVLDEKGNSTKALHHRKIAIRRGPGINGMYYPQDAGTYKKLSAQLVMHSGGDSRSSHAFMDTYRALSGKHVELANSERTREILRACLH